jgi:GTP cyclohydrolase I
MEAAVRALLVGLGEDDQREGLRRTPKRVAKAFRDGTRGMPARILIPSPEHVWIRS